MLAPPLADPHIVWQGNMPWSLDFNDTYASQADPLGEKIHVFLDNSFLPQRWHRRQRFVIGETGFGIGLNFLLTWQRWQQTAPMDAQLFYLAAERYPLHLTDLTRAQQPWTPLQNLAKILRRHWPPREPGFHCLDLPGRVRLLLLFGDVATVLCQLEAQVDAWFLDGFAPARNPAMWTPQVCQQLARLTTPQGSFATFTAAGEVKRALMAAGFQVEKVPGFAGKRDMLRGLRTSNPVIADSAPWFAKPIPLQTGSDRRAVVIGAGLAGTAVAQTLAARHWQVTVIDRGHQPAQGASGNPAGVLMPLIAAHRSHEQRWFNIGYRIALGQWQRLQIPGERCGVIQITGKDRGEGWKQTLLERLAPPPEVLTSLTSNEINALCGLPLDQPGLYLPEAGWLRPAFLCQEQLRSETIRLFLERPITDLIRCHDIWRLQGARGETVVEAPLVIIANGWESNGFAATHKLPLRGIKGQLTQIPTTPISQQLRTVVCGPGYVTPTAANHLPLNYHYLGATYETDFHSMNPTPEANQANLTTLAQFFPSLANTLMGLPMTGRAAIRAASPDHLPLVGPVPFHGDFYDIYHDLPRGRSPTVYPPAPYWPGLYISTGHGSRGLVSTTLAADLLAAMISDEPWPVEKDLAWAVHPARFWVRDLRKPS